VPRVNADRFRVRFNCPGCEFSNSASFRAVRLRQTMICCGCKTDIQLEDHMNSVRRAVRRMRRMMARLQDTLGDGIRLTF